MNVLTLTGRITCAPYVNGAKTVAKITLAVDREFQKDGEKKADFFSVTTFRSISFVEERLKKGMKIAVQGRLQQSEWEDEDTLEKHTGIDIIADRIEVCDWHNTEASDPEPRGAKIEEEPSFETPESPRARAEIGFKAKEDPEPADDTAPFDFS